MNHFMQPEDTTFTVTTPYNSHYISVDAMSGNINISDLRYMRQIASSYLALSPIMEFYSQASEECGGMVQMNTEYGCLPFLLGSDGQPVLLYEFVEVLDECIDYDHIKAELPNLSYGQIASGVAFLRKLSQFNTRNVNIDAMEESALEATPEFQSLIREAMADQEVTRVFSTK